MSVRVWVQTCVCVWSPPCALLPRLEDSVQPVFWAKHAPAWTRGPGRAPAWAQHQDHSPLSPLFPLQPSPTHDTCPWPKICPHRYHQLKVKTKPIEMKRNVWKTFGTIIYRNVDFRHNFIILAC